MRAHVESLRPAQLLRVRHVFLVATVVSPHRFHRVHSCLLTDSTLDHRTSMPPRPGGADATRRPLGQSRLVEDHVTVTRRVPAPDASH
ncbi:hypothetical protein OH77DRAFT_1427016 [Trametes cingulata]|nr:hypothetical protein OH77DRAFT_1427016 [Trametes cingulata]